MPITRPLPATMRYIAAREPGPPDVLALADGPVPRRRPDEVLIEVSHAGVNRPDCAQRAGAYPPPPDASPVIGLEVAGMVVACGSDVTSWHVGRRRLRADAGRRLRRILHDSRGLLPADPERPDAAGSGEPAGEFLHGLEQPLRPRSPEVRRDGADSRRLERDRPHRDPARETDRRHGVHDGRQRRQGGVLPLARRRPRVQLPDAGFRRGDRADHRQARRRRRARHGRRRLHREEPEVPRARRKTAHHRLPARRARRGRLAAAS